MTKFEVLLFLCFYLTISAALARPEIPTLIVQGGKYSKFCFGQSSVYSKSLYHGSEYVSNLQSAGGYYQDCEVIIGNLFLTDLSDSDKFHSIKEVTGFVFIVKPGIKDVKIPNLVRIYGQEKGIVEYEGGALIIDGDEKLKTVDLPALKEVNGKIFKSDNITLHMAKKEKEITVPNACPSGQYITADGKCGTCSKKFINQYCIDVCPGDTLVVNDTPECAFECPRKTEYDPQKADFTCRPCKISPNSNTNNFGKCRRGCYVGYRSALTLFNWRNFYPNPERGGMREFNTSAADINERSDFCEYIYGNLIIDYFEDYKQNKRYIPLTQLQYLSYVKGITGKVTIVVHPSMAYFPYGIFRNLEYIGVSYFIDLGNVKFMEFTVSDPNNLIIGNQEIYTKLGLEKDERIMKYANVNPSKAQCSCPGKCLSAYHCEEKKYFEVRYKAEIYRVDDYPDKIVENVYEVDNNSLLCDKECKNGCNGTANGTSSSLCNSCQHVSLDSFNLKACLIACPLGYFSRNGNKCHRCPGECGSYGCKNRQTFLGARGCKDCDIQYLSSDAEGTFRITCMKAGSDKKEDMFIENAFNQYLSGDDES
uniref:Receptor L-domain domain-containing protein n=1 Tax=Panagrolaimus sp. ES5 TaxID=591445 RepID=A0AC34GBI2_9BILA